jgi:hypothetical protein
VYESDELPEALQRAANEAEGRALADEAIADFSALNPNGGYVAGRSWTDDQRARTRLGDEQVTVRLALARGEQLVPWYGDNELPEWKQWLLSEVKLSARRVARDGEPPGVWRDQITRLRQGWHRFEQDTTVVVLSPEEGGYWSAGIRPPSDRTEKPVTYSAERGFEYRRWDNAVSDFALSEP